MTTLVGYRVTAAAILESPHPKDLQCFVETKIQQAPDFMDREPMMRQLEKDVKGKFGSQFSVFLIDPVTELPSDEWDDAALIVVDAYTACLGVH